MFSNKKISGSLLEAVKTAMKDEESGLRMAAHAAHRQGKKMFSFQGKTYPITVKEGKVEIGEGTEQKPTGNIKIPTSTGTKVLGGRYGSAQAHKDQTKHSLDVMKGPKKKDLIEDENCVTKPQAKTIAKGEVKKHEDEKHGDKGDVAKHEKKMHKEGASFKDKLLEREMTSAETKKKEKMVLAMKDKEGYFKKKYGKRWKDVMYATATKKAMGEELDREDEQVLDEAGSVITHNPSADSDTATDMLTGRVQGVAKANDFKSWKAKIEGDGIKRPQEGEKPEETAARKSIEAHGGPVAQPKIKVGEEVELDEEQLDEKNESHTHAAHYENEKGEWTGMNLFAAKDDEDAIKQAHAKCKDGCKLSRVERHTPVKEELEVVYEAKDPMMDAGVGSDSQFVQNANTSSNPTPLKRVKDLAKGSMKRMKSEMLGKATGNN